MKFGIFGGAAAKRGEESLDSQGYGTLIDTVLEAEDLGYHSVFLVEHHFSGSGQISASLNLLTYLAAKTSNIRLGTASRYYRGTTPFWSLSWPPALI